MVKSDFSLQLPFITKRVNSISYQYLTVDFHSDEICMSLGPQRFLGFQVSLMNSSDRYLSACVELWDFS